MEQRTKAPTLTREYTQVAHRSLERGTSSTETELRLAQLMLQAEQSESRSDYFYYLREADRLRSTLSLPFDNSLTLQGL